MGVWRRSCCKNVQTHSSTDVSLCVKCICQRSACLPCLACQSVSQCTCKKRGRHFSVWVAGICLSIAGAFSLYFYVCLSANLTVGSVCRRREAGILGWRAPRRERRGAHLSLWVFGIAGGLIRCPPGSAVCSGRRRSDGH